MEHQQRGELPKPDLVAFRYRRYLSGSNARFKYVSAAKWKAGRVHRPTCLLDAGPNPSMDMGDLTVS